MLLPKPFEKVMLFLAFWKIPNFPNRWGHGCGMSLVSIKLGQKIPNSPIWLIPAILKQNRQLLGIKSTYTSNYFILLQVILYIIN